VIKGFLNEKLILSDIKNLFHITIIKINIANNIKEFKSFNKNNFENNVLSKEDFKPI